MTLGVIFAMLLSAATAAPIAGDFDRDGIADKAEVRPIRGGEVGLFVLRGAAGSRPELVQKVAAKDLPNFFVEPMKVANLHTWCSTHAGHRACDLLPPEDSELLTFGSSEASQAVAFWRGDRFEVVWITD